MAKEIMYRGINTEELRNTDVREFAKMVKSRARRTILRQSAELERFLAKCKELKEKNKPIRTHLRHLIIVPQMVDYNILIHNGKQFLPVIITGEMLGHRLGEFAVTREKVKHGAAGIGSTKSSMAKATKKT